jgi:hypothetical protein
MGKILVLEDRGSIYTEIKEMFEDQGYETIKAIQISDAIDIITNQELKIIFCIIDLMLSPSGLSDEDINRSDKGKLAGWFFIKRFLLERGFNRNQIVIYSDYIPNLEQNIEKEELHDIKLFKKRKHKMTDIIEYFNKLSLNG